MFCLAWLVARARAAEPDDSNNRGDEPESIKVRGWQPIFKRMAEDYRIAPANEPNSEFKLKLPPVFRWTQPVRGGDDGALFVWLDRGRVVHVLRG
jgi:hypothetical protein